MAKSVLYYKRKFQAVAGTAANVTAYRRNGEGPILYRIGCYQCEGLLGERRSVYGRGAQFHLAMRHWALHMVAMHYQSLNDYEPDPPLSDTEISDYRKRGLQRAGEIRLLNQIFGERKKSTPTLGEGA